MSDDLRSTPVLSFGDLLHDLFTIDWGSQMTYTQRFNQVNRWMTTISTILVLVAMGIVHLIIQVRDLSTNTTNLATQVVEMQK